MQKIATANNEITYTIRPAIAEKVIPSVDMLDALFSATARKYSVNESDLYSIASLVDELMKEVMDNTFLSFEQKIEFCQLLSSLKKAGINEADQRIEVIRVSSDSSTDTSAMLGTMTAIMALGLTLFLYLKSSDQFLSDDLIPKYLPLLAIIIAVPIMSILLRDMLKRISHTDTEIKGKEKIETPRNEGREPNRSIGPTVNVSGD
ncbi:hypothetical protein [Candidatus Thiosymbion oneisti]|uniref:hypothetical protein n=1 Tax=Candidatus Thiosymbion oneisti TaxID=589554 RepID=UPI0013FDCF57|nr:hypothetical protein [Candidatus Thiosymbion oneisti]